MTLVKHSERTIRKGCKDCGSKDLYWYHNSDGKQGNHYCQEHDSHNWTLVNAADGSIHDCKGTGTEMNHNSAETAIESRKSEAESFAATAHETSETIVTVDGTAGNVDSDAGEMAQLRKLLMGILGTPKIDEADVQRIIRAELDGVVFPTRTVVVRDEVKHEIEGNAHAQLADVMTAVLAGEHVMMVGPAGTGKSTIAEQSAEGLGLASYSISLSPQTPASAFLGYMDANGNYVRTLFREAYENGGLFHFDEVDNAHPSVLAVINAALANGRMAFPDGMVKRNEDFRAVASANTYGRGATRQYVGRQAIDAATLDRFTVITIEIDDALETALCGATSADAATVTKVLSTVRAMRLRAEQNGLAVVLSPRATVGMCKLISAGMSWEQALESRVRRGLDDATWRKVAG